MLVYLVKDLVQLNFKPISLKIHCIHHTELTLCPSVTADYSPFTNRTHQVTAYIPIYPSFARAVRHT